MGGIGAWVFVLGLEGLVLGGWFWLVGFGLRVGIAGLGILLLWACCDDFVWVGVIYISGWFAFGCCGYFLDSVGVEVLWVA